MIHRGSLTIRTLRTPRLVSVGEEIVLAGAVQALGGVLSGRGACGTAEKAARVVEAGLSLETD